MAFSRHARLLKASWRAERRTLRQGLVALVLSTGAGFLAGLTLAHVTGRLERLPGPLVLIPAAFGLATLTHLRHPRFGIMVGGTLLAGVMTLPVMLGVSYEVAVVTARYRLDPDNLGVPIITSVMDLAGVAAFLLSMTLLGVAVR